MKQLTRAWSTFTSYLFIAFGIMAVMGFGSAADSLPVRTLFGGLALGTVAIAGGALCEWLSNK